MQALVIVFRVLYCPTTSKGVGVMPLMVRRTLNPIQFALDSARDGLQTRTTVFPPVNAVKNARTMFGLLGTGTWALAGAAAESNRAIANAEVFAEKGINSPFVRNRAPASAPRLNWQVGGE